MALVANSPQDRVEQLTTLTRRLTDLIMRETELFTARRPLEAAPFRDEKAKLANIYRQETMRITRDPGLIDGADADARAALKAAVAAFMEALETHAAALSALQDITEGLVHSIAQHVAETRQATALYGPNAARTERDPRHASAITLNATA